MSDLNLEITNPQNNILSIENSLVDTITNIDINSDNQINIDIVNTEKILFSDLPDSYPFSSIIGDVPYTRVSGLNNAISGLLPITSLVPSTGIGITQSGTVFTIAITGTLGSTQSQTDIDARVNFLTSGVYAPLSGAVFTGSVSGPSGNFTSLSVNSTGVSVSGHTHTASNITNFNSSVSGLLPVGTTNYLSKFGTGGSGLNNSVIYESNNNIGIGTAVPSGKLDVNGTLYVGTTNVANNLYIRTGQAGISQTALRLRTDTSSNLFLDAVNAYVKVGNQSADVDIYAGNGPVRIGNNSAQTLTNQNIRFVPANTEVMRITPTGVGIGTSAPSGLLNVHAGMGSDYTSACFTTDGVATTTHIGVGNSDTRPILASLNGNLSSSNFGWGFFDRGADGDFRIARKGGSTSWADVLSIRRSNGFVGIGTTIPNEALEVSGNIRLSDTATSAGHRLQLFRGGGSAYDYTLSKEGNHIALSTANDASTTRSVQIGSHVSGVWIPKIHLNGWTGAVGINNTYTNIQSSMLVVRGSGDTSSTSTVNFTNSSNTSLFSVRDDGMVGIGTTNPSGQLHVIGTGIFSSVVGVGINAPLDLIHISGSSLNAQGIRIDNGDGYGGSIQADNNALVLSSPTAVVCRLQASKIRMGNGTSSTAIELTSNGSISQNGNGGGLTFIDTTAQFSNGINVTNSGIFSSGIVVGNGTVSNPSIVFDGARTIGFSATSNLLEVSVLGNRVMRMSQFGTVAINRGTASALGTLHVQGNGSNPANTSDPIIVTSSVGSGSIIRFTDSASNDWQIGVNPNGSIQTGTGSGNFAITRITSNAGVPYLTINSSGNIGIGTTTPSGQLHVIGTGIFSNKLGVGISNFPTWISQAATPHTFVHISGASGLFPDTNERAFGSLLRLNSGASTNNPRIDFRIGGPGNYDSHFFISRNGTDVIGIDTSNKMFLSNGFTILNPTNNGEGVNASIVSYNDPASFVTLDNNTRSMNIGYRGKGPGDQYIDVASSGRLKIYNYYLEVATFDNRGRFGLGTTTPTSVLDINSNSFRVRTAKTPTSATDTGNAGDICWDSNYIYICVTTNTWKRSAITTW